MHILIDDKNNYIILIIFFKFTLIIKKIIFHKLKIIVLNDK